MAEEKTTPLARWNVGSHVNSIAVSHDSTRVVSGSRDHEVFVWDMHTRALVLGPFEELVEVAALPPVDTHPTPGLQDHNTHIRTGIHTGTVCSVAFSPDSTRIVSGSGDHTVRIWDTRTGIPIGGPLRGHTEAVYSVAFSSNNTHIVSGSYDRTIRIWDANTGSLVGEPLRGHTSDVCSVTFSPYGTRIISGSADCTIRIWDARTGIPIGEPLRGHTSDVRCVAFSPGSTYIASGSADSTIRIWDARTGTPIGEPLRGHTKAVCSVAFSPDSARIVSGSHDRTINIWDTHTGTLIGEPLRGHNKVVRSVVFSPDSTRIVSASEDCTICLWEVSGSTPSFEMVTSTMPTQEIFECLVKHGCTDLTSSMDIGRRSSSVVASGGFGDVWRVTMNDKTFVAVKTLRLHILFKGDDKGVKRAAREVYIWSRLQHPNIQKLLGIVEFQGGLGMVSPWMEGGNLQQYIAANPGVERYPWCIQLTSGVSYLHGIEMVHGDLKASNVLVSDDGVLKINDFDHAMLSESTLRFSTTTRPGGGTLRWMAPELFEAEKENVEKEPQISRNKKTDVYALAMTILEIFTGMVPYAEYRTDAGVCGAILKKQIPRRPVQLSGPDKPTKRIWKLLMKCWDHDPAARPDAASILESLELRGSEANNTMQTESSALGRLKSAYQSIVR